MVDVDEDAGVGCAVCTWELDGGRRGGAGSGDVQLEAFGVELRAPNGACDVQGWTCAVVSAMWEYKHISGSDAPMTSARRR